MSVCVHVCVRVRVRVRVCVHLRVRVRVRVCVHVRVRACVCVCVRLFLSFCFVLFFSPCMRSTRTFPFLFLLRALSHSWSVCHIHAPSCPLSGTLD